MYARRFAALLLIVLPGFAALSSCDTAEEVGVASEITFEGVTYAAIGQARLEETDQGLVVRDIGLSGNDGVRVSSETPIQEAEVRSLPIDIPENGRWGMQVFGELEGERRALATVWNDAVDAETYELTFDYAPELEVSNVSVEYYLAGVLVHAVTIPVGPGVHQAAAASAGQGSSEPQSVHVVCVNGELIVATDHGGDAPFTSGGPCQAELLEGVPGAELPICTDFIRARPLSEVRFPEVTSLEVRARTLSQFTITNGFVR